MATEIRQYPFMFFGSVNRRVNPFLMKDEELLDSVNFWTEHQLGAKKVRPGYVPFLDRVDTSPVRGLFYVKFPNGNIRVARISGAKIYIADPLSATGWGSAKLTLVENFVRPEYSVLAGKAHIVTKTGETTGYYLEWDNTDTVTLTTYASGTEPVVPHRAKTITTYHNAIYVGNSTDGAGNYDSHLSWSSVSYEPKGSSPSTPWTTQQTITDPSYAAEQPIDNSYRGGILKITNINDRVNIYKEEGVYRFNETSVFDIFGISPIEGTITTMQDMKQDYFLTNEGFFRTDGNETVPVGDNWYDIIQQIVANGYDPDKLHSFAGNFKYFCYMGDIHYDGKTVQNACFVYDAYAEELSLWSFYHDISSFGYYIDAGGRKHIIMGDVDGYTYRLTESADTDDGHPIIASLRTKYFFFDDPHKQNSLNEVYGFSNQASELTIQLDRDYKKQYDFDAMALKEVIQSKAINAGELGAFRNLSAQISWNGQGKRPEFYGIIFTIAQESERKDV